MTKHGQQCRNSPAKGAGKQYCYLHTPQGSKDIPTPTSEAKNDTSVGFESWIPGDLSPTTKVKIRAKMAESLSQSENPGYVYAFEIVDPETPDYIHIKVGYSKNVLQRLSQWQRQCPSKEIKLRGGWPSTLKTEYVNQTTGEYVESIRFENPTKYPHRVEQLVHLELEDVALHSLHLKPEHRRPAASCPSMSRRCLDCGRLHREIFSFKRFTEPGLKGCEFDKVVLPVIEHWGRFVSQRG
ncbi:hypothetical protein FRC12_014306 [Ceratobasidium sp. 428]|nr:hypothetical protein FRC12_014306 [Ceratobasidium sp. 428]